MALNSYEVHICLGCSLTDSVKAHVVVSGIRNKILFLPCFNFWHSVIPRVFNTFIHLFRPCSTRSSTNHVLYLVYNFDVGILYVSVGFQVFLRLLMYERIVVVLNQRCFLGVEWARCYLTFSCVFHGINSPRSYRSQLIKIHRILKNSRRPSWRISFFWARWKVVFNQLSTLMFIFSSEKCNHWLPVFLWRFGENI